MMYGQRIRYLREQVGLSQAGLVQVLTARYGEQYHMSPGAIGKYEQEQREPPIDLLIKIAQFFGVSLDYLLGAQPADNLPRLQEVQRKLCTLSNKALDEVDVYIEFQRWRNSRT